MRRIPVCLLATVAILGSAGLALAAAPDTAGQLATSTSPASSDGTPPPVTTAIPTAAAVHPAMAEIFRPAPLPGEDERAPTRRVADAGPNLHPDVLGIHEKSDGVLSDTDLAYARNERMKPAGGMSLNIPMQ